MKRPELLTTARSVTQAERLLALGADAIVIGNDRFGMRLPGSFSLTEIAETISNAHALGAKCYVTINVIMHNDILAELPAFLAECQQMGADAFIFSDPAVIVAMQQQQIKIPLHWNPETIATNYFTANYWGTKGATRMIAARELNLEQLQELKQNLKMELQVQVHGMTCIYHSKRDLLSNYVEYVSRDERVQSHSETLGPSAGLILREKERPDERFPVYEDQNGTHMMSADDICMLENIHELLEIGIDSLKIEGLLQSDEYMETIVRLYRETIDQYLQDPQNYEFDERTLQSLEEVQPQNRPLSFGFFFKEQVY